MIYRKNVVRYIPVGEGAVPDNSMHHRPSCKKPEDLFVLRLPLFLFGNGLQAFFQVDLLDRCHNAGIQQPLLVGVVFAYHFHGVL